MRLGPSAGRVAFPSREKKLGRSALLDALFDHGVDDVSNQTGCPMWSSWPC